MTAMQNPQQRDAGTETDYARRELGTPYPAFPERLPHEVLTAGRSVVRFAQTVEDRDAIERLRFQVYNLELGEGLDSAFASGRDHDDLDPHFHHLLISCETTGEVVGTYRLQTSEMAAAAGFYSAAEFDLSGLPEEYLRQAVEVGRACVAKGHRNGRVLNLLWRGLALYLVHNEKRHLFGCCSLTSQDEALGLATMQHLMRAGHVHPTLLAPPLPALSCSEADPAAVAA